MPFNAMGRWISVEQAEDAMQVPPPDFEEDDGRAHVLAWYEGLRNRMDDLRAFSGCVAQFGFPASVRALAKVSAAAKRHQPTQQKR